MDLRADALDEIKAQFSELGRWEVISANDHVQTVPGAPPTMTRHVTLTAQEVATGRVLIFMLEGEGAGTPTSGTLQWGGSSFAFDDGDLIDRLMGALEPEAETVFHDELMEFLTGEVD